MAHAVPGTMLPDEIVMHAPAEQNCVDVQRTPHPPQLVLSLRTSTHAPPHTMLGAEHGVMHEPPAQS